jgi:cell wall-associated NlpC family hydrolase
VKAFAAVALALAVLAGMLGFAIVASAVSILGAGGPGSLLPTGGVAGDGGGVGGEPPTIPPAMLALYQGAAATCPGLPWTVLAAIGTIESDNGQSTLLGVHSGANPAGAEGPMQFEPTTFAAYDEPVPPGGATPPSPYDPADAVYAAARLLCANGAANGADIPGAVYSYNHSAAYVSQVLTLAEALGPPQTAPPTGTAAASDAGALAVEWALSQIGTPYTWGGETPGVGFDCSGLVQAAYKVAGITLPRVAQDQYDATTKLGQGAPLAPGDLIFFGAGPTAIDHVGLFVGVLDGASVMVDAPYTGARVRAEAFRATVGASFGSLPYVGATRPAA